MQMYVEDQLQNWSSEN